MLPENYREEIELELKKLSWKWDFLNFRDDGYKDDWHIGHSTNTEPPFRFVIYCEKGKAFELRGGISGWSKMQHFKTLADAENCAVEYLRVLAERIMTRELPHSIFLKP